jgi:predicted CoA-binding protein
MARVPESIARFLQGKRIAVAGVSRKGDTAANAVFKKLRDSGYDAVPINPHTSSVEGTACYPSIASIEGPVDGVIVATHPNASLKVVREALDRGVKQIWFHRSFGQGSVSQQAIDECTHRGVTPIVGGCPLMYCEPVDVGHRCMRGWLSWRGQLPSTG